MAIGDDLMVMLGLVPVRDRAGIARGTMANEAVAAAAASPNAEGRTLMDQGMRPPALALPPQMRGGGDADIRLPDDVPVEYAAGKSKVPAVSPQVLPPSQDRVVTSSPAAAPSTEVRAQNSDILLEAYKRQQQQQKMMQVIASIGLIANGAFNRNPDSQSSTRESLGTMLAGGGGGGGGGGELGTLKTLLEMRDAEAAKREAAAAIEARVQNLMRQNGWDRQRAVATVASGVDEFEKPAYGIAREEAKRLEAQRLRILANPKLIEQLAKDNGVTVEMMTEQLQRGDISSLKDLSAIAHQRATTGKIGAETDEMRRATEQKRVADAAYTFYKDHPEAFARLHGLQGCR